MCPRYSWKVKNSTEGRPTDGNKARLYSKDVFVWLPTDTASTGYTCMSLSICIHPSHPLWKGRSDILQLYTLPNISPCCYLQVQHTYLNELYGGYSGTACACANSGYQEHLSNFCRAPGNRARYFQTYNYVNLHILYLYHSSPLNH